MANKIQIRRGVEADLPILDLGEFGFTTDTNKLFIGNGVQNVEIGRVDYIDGRIAAFRVNWGEISGDLASQTDLKNALDLKASLEYVDQKISATQQGIEYIWASTTEMNQQTGMTKDELGLNNEDRKVYRYDGSQWTFYYALDAAHNHDDRYYTKTETTDLLNQKSDVEHTHTEADITNLDKYTKAEVDAKLATKLNKAGYNVVDDNPEENVWYIGKADFGVATNEAKWQIKKIVFVGTNKTTYWADGDQEFDNVWDDRLTLVYSL